MFDNLTYKKKCMALLFITFVVLMACYKKTFKDMFAAKRQLSAVEEKLTNTSKSQNRLAILNREVFELDYLIGGQTNNPENVQYQILDFISNNSLKVNIVSIQDVHLFNSDEFLVYSNVLELSGTYEELVKMLYEVETLFTNSRVVSSQFYTQNLFLKIILQNYDKAN